MRTVQTISGTKVQPFGTDNDESKFHAELRIWRDEVINGSGIKSTAFTRDYKINRFTKLIRVYKHYQIEHTGQASWQKETNASESAHRARETVRGMRAMLYRIEEAVNHKDPSGRTNAC